MKSTVINTYNKIHIKRKDCNLHSNRNDSSLRATDNHEPYNKTSHTDSSNQPTTTTTESKSASEFNQNPHSAIIYKDRQPIETTTMERPNKSSTKVDKMIRNIPIPQFRLSRVSRIALLSSTSSSAPPSKEESMGSRLFIPNRLASYVNYNRQSLINNHFTPAADSTSNRPRWVSFLGGSRRPSASTPSDLPPPSVYPNFLRPSTSRVISFLLSNINSRIGLQNSLRVSNVLRDLAWQVLARLSIPTPVIYELRRMNIYPPDEHQLDFGLGGNKSVTIRSKKMLVRPKRSIMDRIRSSLTGEESDDEEESESGLMSRLTDLFDRGYGGRLIGRVVQLPFWLPFRRGEQGRGFLFGARDKTSEEDDDGPIIRIPGNNQVNGNNNDNKGKTSKVETQRKSSNRNNKKGTNQTKSTQRKTKSEKTASSENRPLISVDGKNYYLDDDNKLRTLN